MQIEFLYPFQRYEEQSLRISVFATFRKETDHAPNRTCSQLHNSQAGQCPCIQRLTGLSGRLGPCFRGMVKHDR